MTVDEIFSQIGQRMVEGLMAHSQLADYYNFLGLRGFYRCHKYHYFIENKNYKCVSDYYMKHYNKLLAERRFSNPNIIPENWYKYSRLDVTNANRKGFVQAGIEKWVNWEFDTKKLYEAYYKDLLDMGEEAAAIEVAKYLKDVDEELAEAWQKNLELKCVDYDINQIMDMQPRLHDKYKKKLKRLKL